MEFIIQRASQFFKSEQDIPGATIKEVINDSKENSEGYRNIYSIEVESIDKLMKLINKFNEKIIVSETNWFFVDDKRPTITIYDDLVE
jgi:cystathionine beta-lyase family protein involved in aluminum resistance